jgi:hypothetical protein
MSFTVSVPAADRNLLTLAEIKLALGVTDSSQDAALTALGLRVSDMIAEFCRVPRDGVTPPTLRRETLIDTMRLDGCVSPLILTRRFVDTVSSITVDGTALETTDYETDKSAGLVKRISSSGSIISWSGRVIVVTYLAGFGTVPEALKLAAITVLREQSSAAERDPLLKRERVDGIGEREFWVSAAPGISSVGAISGVAASMLDPYL